VEGTGFWLVVMQIVLIGKPGDQAYANKASLVGSIGVIATKFNFRNQFDRLNIDREVVHTGDKLLMRYFDPLKDPSQFDSPEAREFLDNFLEQVYIKFKDHIRKTRGKKLKGTEEQLFNADIWHGEEAKELGIVDEIGTLDPVMREMFPDAKIRDFSVTKPFEKLMQNLSRDTANVE